MKNYTLELYDLPNHLGSLMPCTQLLGDEGTAAKKSKMAAISHTWFTL